MNYMAVSDALQIPPSIFGKHVHVVLSGWVVVVVVMGAICVRICP